jgi:putative endonuclease
LTGGPTATDTRVTREFNVYILANYKRGTIYVGVTGNLEKRLAQHRSKTVDAFTRRYALERLVHVETFADPREAIAREKRLKKWPRAWKLAFVEERNPEWHDLAGEPG